MTSPVQPGPVSQRDLDEMIDATTELHRSLDGSRVLVTGGTGFFGRWLLESWVDAGERLGLRRTAVVVSRNLDSFVRSAPHLAAHPSIELVSGDVLGPAPVSGQFDACIHAATAASLALTETDPRLMFDTVVLGTANVLEWMSRSGEVPLLFTSSGAVYGAQDPSVSRVAEGTASGPDPLAVSSVYAEAKRAAEMLCAIESGRGPACKIARCFAFVGPHLPIDTHFAIGNFIRDGLAGGPIVLQGDGTPVRSYLYATDLVIWLWTILLRGTVARPYNVGSPVGHHLSDIAGVVADACGGIRVERRQEPVPGRPASRYVPDVTRAAVELGLRETVGLDDAVRRTLAWYRELPEPSDHH